MIYLFALISKEIKMKIRGSKIYLSDELDKLYADELAKMCNDFSIYKNIGSHSFPNPYTREDAINFLTLSRSMGSEIFSRDFLIYSADKIAGVIGLSDINQVDRSAHIGYLIGKEFRNRGYASDAVSLVCQYAKESMNLIRLYTKVLEYNTPSLRVLQKNGFDVEGYERNCFLFQGKYYDMFLLAKLL